MMGLVQKSNDNPDSCRTSKRGSGNKMKDTIIVGGLQKFSKAMISSVLYLPAIGMVMVVCNIFTNANITNALPLLQQDWLYLPFKVIYDALLRPFLQIWVPYLP
ncbi:MAG: hypothetical protein ACLTW9_03760 [Enterocloster sp.]